MLCMTPTISVYIVICALPSLVVRLLFRNTSAVIYPRFCVSQARVLVVLGVCPGTRVVPSRSVSSVLDILTHVWCWLVSTVLWLVLVERQLDLSSVTVRLRDSSCVVLSGLDTCLIIQ
ncbi:hypothetical protein Taro_037848 [Colocasia esculenta]|uniref:Uncharacterized protein n=1 Tax=Colocasia esculenta TaxID=4460 RepID=A0A843W569_COLES|nr:hypothetical protein [Colocasia esculenta]